MKKRFGKFQDYNDWKKPRIVENALELLDKELEKLKGKVKSVYMCFATDLFMYQQKEIIDLSLKIIERLNKEGINVITISKGVYPKGLLNKDIYSDKNSYGSTIITLSEDFRKKYEPHSASMKERIRSLKKLHNNGLKTWVIMEPYPTPNIVKQDIEDILKEISFVDEIVFGKWNYSKLVSKYPDHKSFYKNNALKVIDFCEKNNIKYYVKKGTF